MVRKIKKIFLIYQFYVKLDDYEYEFDLIIWSDDWWLWISTSYKNLYTIFDNYEYKCDILTLYVWRLWTLIYILILPPDSISLQNFTIKYLFEIDFC